MGPGDPTPSNEVVVARNATIIDPVDVEYVIDRVESCGDILVSRAYAEEESLVVGSAVVTGVSPKTPHGLLRRVVGTKDEGENVRLITQQGDLMDVIESCRIVARVPIDLAEVDSISTIEGFTQVPSKAGLEQGFDFTADVIVHDRDGNPATVDDQIRITGEVLCGFAVHLEIDIDFDDTWPSPRATRMVLASERAVDAELITHFGANATSVPLQREMRVATIHAGSVTVFAGPVPIVLVLDIDLGFAVSLSGGASLELGYRLRETSTMGYLYEIAPQSGRSKWSEIQEVEKSAEILQVEVGGSSNARSGYYAKNDIELYGVPGPSIRGDGYAKCWAQTTPGTAGALIDVAAEMGIGAFLTPNLSVLGDPSATSRPEWTLVAWQIYKKTISVDGESKIVVAAHPDALNPAWVLTGVFPIGESYRLEGSGDRTLENMKAGTYTLEWAAAAGWITPAPQTKVLSDGEVLTFAAAYASDAPPQPPEGFVFIPPGTFMMGSATNVPEGAMEREPLHSVTLTRGFYMSRYEVTEQWWSEVMGEAPSTSQLPKGKVSWNRAVQFCNALSLREGLTPAYTISRSGRDVTWDREADGYRLPTDAEWEYACRAGTTTSFNNGTNCLSSDTEANFLGDYVHRDCTPGISRGTTMVVGSFPPNAWGLYDMHGNLCEWVWDGYRVDYQNLPETDPACDVGEKPNRVLRSGSMSHHASACRSSTRFSGAQIPEHSIDGLRPVRTAP